jgi:hypothetical protein
LVRCSTWIMCSIMSVGADRRILPTQARDLLHPQ